MRREDVSVGRLYLGWVPENSLGGNPRLLFKFVVKELPFFYTNTGIWMVRGRISIPSMPGSAMAFKDPVPTPCNDLVIEAGVVE